MDIIGNAQYPASALSNFAPHTFMFDGVRCASMEGLLQSFKEEDIVAQHATCLLVGAAAKKHGKARNAAWKQAQRLWWKGIGYPRKSFAYQDLLDRAFESLFGNIDFRNALLLSGNEVLTHSIGNPDPCDTVLTEAEFCSRLMLLRSRLSLTGP